LKKYFKVGIVFGIIAVSIILLLHPLIKVITTDSGNIASKYCLEHGGSSFIMTTKTADRIMDTGICEFPGGFQCEEWAYYRGECQPPE